MPRAATLDRNQSALERLEERNARRVAAAYRQARAEIVDQLITRWNAPAAIDPAEAASLLRRLGLLEQIDGRLRQLESELHIILRDVVNSSTELALEQMRREIALLPPSLRTDRVGTFGTINHQMVEQFLPVAVQDAALATRSLSLQVQRELQTGLLQGQSFDSLVRRVMSATPTGVGPAVWSNGALSAERMVRRSVIASENGAKQASIAEAQREIPELQKQWVSTIGRETTDCCLRAHGQIQPVDEPFILTGTPRFADQMMTPPGHWNCRSSVVMHHPIFEQSGLTTPNMRRSAQAELARRENEPSRRQRTV